MGIEMVVRENDVRRCVWRHHVVYMVHDTELSWPAKV